MSKVFALLMSSFLLVGCPPQEPPRPPEPKDTGHCGVAEERLEELKCMDRRGNPMWVNLRGERFKTTCERLQREGGIAVDPACVSTAGSCEEAKGCPTL